MSNARPFLTWALLTCALSSSPAGSLEQAWAHGVSPVSVPTGSVRAGGEQIQRPGPRTDADQRLDDLPPSLPGDVGRDDLVPSIVGQAVRTAPASPATRTILTYRANAPPESDLI